MTATRLQTDDVAGALATALAGIAGLRVYTYVADNFRPPAVVISLPDIDYADPSAGFCFATWVFPLGVVVSRNSDSAAQRTLAQLVQEVAYALHDNDFPELHTVEPLDARPATVAVAGQDLPGYIITARVRA